MRFHYRPFRFAVKPLIYEAMFMYDLVDLDRAGVSLTDFAGEIA